MSYRPKIKIDLAGNTKDLDLDAKTLEGASWKDIVITNKDYNYNQQAALTFDAGQKEFVFYSPVVKDYDSIIEAKQTQITNNKAKIDSHTTSINTINDNISNLSSSVSLKVNKTDILSSGTNFNNIISSGFYRIINNNENSPSDSDYSQMIVVHGGGDTIAQIVFCYDNNNVWVRAGNPVNNSTGHWNDWARLAFANEIPDLSSFLQYSPLNGGLIKQDSSSGWGKQTGSEIASWSDNNGGGLKLRKDCPNSGQMSVVIDGRFYQNEGNYEVLDENNGLKQVAEGGLEPTILPRGYYLVLPLTYATFTFEDGTHDGDDNANSYQLCIGILNVASSSVAYIHINAGSSATNGARSSRCTYLDSVKVYKLYTY